MIEWINFSVMILSVIFLLYFYVKSVGPKALENKIGEIAYQKCARYRLISSIFMFIYFANYVIYIFYPLSVRLPRTFPWSYWVSFLIAVLIAIPGGYLMYRGVKDAGKETLVPKKEHVLYKGIYQKIRHPQAVGEMPFAWVFSFILNSPFLVLFSFILIPMRDRLSDES